MRRVIKTRVNELEALKGRCHNNKKNWTKPRVEREKKTAQGTEKETKWTEKKTNRNSYKTKKKIDKEEDESAFASCYSEHKRENKAVINEDMGKRNI